MSIKIQVDPARLDSAVGQIEQRPCTTKELPPFISGGGGDGHGWQEGYQAFVSQIQGFEKDFQQMAALMREYAAFLKLSAKTYRQTQDERAQMARRLVN
ncbi:MAG: WXG100 family type VII secretion target [[Clostridium] innocuum]